MLGATISTPVSWGETPEERCKRETEAYNRLWQEAWIRNHPKEVAKGGQPPSPTPPYRCYGNDNPQHDMPGYTPPPGAATPPAGGSIPGSGSPAGTTPAHAVDDGFNDNTPHFPAGHRLYLPKSPPQRWKELHSRRSEQYNYALVCVSKDTDRFGCLRTDNHGFYLNRYGTHTF
ncbi:hypothetical protein AL705_04975 [Lawsonella clevelandensis]|uniref:Uncharacterized protein n=1 Tax=Lawsonella clevelandensis TaxID=1528099 RepID=A0A0M4MZY4_9ACTN|nr:hypothetical protein [Lawsonella clevelandensis]ALE19073.1 hypothetical protein AL705_04975 [Lawsonella clevelandensis]